MQMLCLGAIFQSLISLLTSALCLRSYKSKPPPPPLVGFNYCLLSSVSQSLLLPSDCNNAKTIYGESRARWVAAPHREAKAVLIEQSQA